MIPSILMLLDWAASGVAATVTYATHYHVLQGPSAEQLGLVGPSGEKHVLAGAATECSVLEGSD